MSNYPVPGFVLAPMEGATDFAMRRLLTGIGGIDLCVSEFIRVAGHVPPRRVFRRDVPESTEGWRTRAGTPVFAQILGGDAGRMAQTAASLDLFGAPGVDINFGCPAKTVNRHDGGSCLLQYPDRVFAIVKAVREAVSPLKPVTVKIRLGWENPRDVFRIAPRIQAAGASWLTVHARTKSEGYTGRAHWDILRDLRSEIDTPLVANGDITSVEDYERCRALTGCRHFMIGRGVLRDPYLFYRIRHGSGSFPESLPDLLWDFITVSRGHAKRPHAAVGRTKQFVKLMGHRDNLMNDFFEFIKPVRASEELVKAFQLFFRRSDSDLRSAVSGQRFAQTHLKSPALTADSPGPGVLE